MSDSSSSGATRVSLSNRQVFDIAIQMLVGAAFLVVSFRILEPFLTLIVWGGVMAIALYPLYQKLVTSAGGRGKLVATVFVLIALAVIVVPVIMMSSSIFDTAKEIGDEMEEGTLQVPPPPPRVEGWPVVGTKVHSFWLQASNNLQAFAKQYNEQVKTVLGDVVAALAGAGASLLQFIFSVLIAAFFLVSGEACASGLRLVATRVFGADRGEAYMDLSAKTVRSVATGVLGVAFIQAVLAGIGMSVAGVPWAGVWSLLVLLLAIMQLPPLIILLPLALWVFGSSDNQVIAWAFLVWALLVSFSDAVLKPMLLGRGVNVPMIVILLGAIGGMIVSGIIGLFVGAVILALGYRLMMEWLSEETATQADEPPAEPAAA